MRLMFLVALFAAGCSRNLLELVDNAVEPPIVTRFVPTAGLAGQTAVRIEGRNFPADARVFFGTQPGLWAIGAAYASSDTVLYAIPPLGTPADTEISVVGSNGEGRAPGLFRVFDEVATLTAATPQRITQSSHVVVIGNNLNARDVDARLLLGSQVVEDFVLSGDRIEFDVSSVDDFEEVGHGWKFLRYQFTPFFDGGPSEAVLPVYVAAPPELVGVEERAHANGPLTLWVTGWDTFDPFDLGAYNRVAVGGFAATIISARPYVGDDSITEVLVRVPNVAADYSQNVRYSTLGNREAHWGRVDIIGSGNPYGDATEQGCETGFPAFVTSAVANSSYNVDHDEFVVTGVVDTQVDGYPDLIGVAGITQEDTWSVTLYETGTHGNGYPLAALPFIFHDGAYGISSYLVAAYRLSGGTQHLDLELVKRDLDDGSTLLRCTVATMSAPVPAEPMGLDIERIYSADGVRVSLHDFGGARGPERNEESWRDEERASRHRFVIALDSDFWRDVYELRVTGADLTACTAPEALTPKISFTRPGGGALRPTRLAVSAARRDVIWAAQDLEMRENYWRTSMATFSDGTYASTQLFADDATPCPGAWSMAATRDGFLTFRDDRLCRLRLTQNVTGTMSAELIFEVSVLGGCFEGGCSPMWLSPNERELWVGHYHWSMPGPMALRGLLRLDADSGALLEPVGKTPPAMSTMAFSHAGRHVRTFTGDYYVFFDLVSQAESSQRQTCVYR